MASALSITACAQDHPVQPAPLTTEPAATPAPAVTATSATVINNKEMTDGEIRKVDMENKKITLKHGEIKNLDMPGMTMVFQVKDPAIFTKVKAGDKVKFRAEKIDGAFVVTEVNLTK